MSDDRDTQTAEPCPVCGALPCDQVNQADGSTEMDHYLRAKAQKVAGEILGYFESYNLAAITPIVCEIEAALYDAYGRGVSGGV